MPKNLSESICLLAAMTAMLLAGQARGDDKPEASASDPAAMFAQLDANKDGQLSGDEIPDDKKRLFERLVRVADKNGDGKLSSEEFAAGLARRPQQPEAANPPGGGPEGKPAPEKMFKRLDANGDGKVTLDEVPEPRRDMFKQLVARGDKDGDGALTKKEFLRAFPGGGDPPKGKPDAAKRPEGRARAEEFFRRMDANGDGKVTLDEVPEPRRPMVEKLISRGDKDGDKALTLNELVGAFGGGQPGNPQTPGERLAPPPGLFFALDANRDGKLDAAEIAAAADVIRKLDKNGDGNVTFDEILPPAPEPEAKP